MYQYRVIDASPGDNPVAVPKFLRVLSCSGLSPQVQRCHGILRLYSLRVRLEYLFIVGALGRCHAGSFRSIFEGVAH